MAYEVLTPFSNLPDYFIKNVPVYNYNEFKKGHLYFAQRTKRILRFVENLDNTFCFADTYHKSFIIYSFSTRNSIIYREDRPFEGSKIYPLIPMEISKHVDEEYGYLFS